MLTNAKLTAVAAALMLEFAAGTHSQAADRPLRVAVYDFDQKAGGMDASDLGKKAALLITSDLVSSGAKVDIINRDQIERILKEQNLQFSDLFDPNGAVQIGKLLTADAIVTGSIEGQVASRNIGIGPLKRVSFKASVGGTAQLVSIATGKILIAPSTRREADVSSGIQVNSNQMGNAGAKDDALNKAVEAACTALAAEISSHLNEVPRPTAPLPVPEITKQQQPPPPPQTTEPQPVYAPLTGELGPIIRVKGNVVTFSLSQGTHHAGEVLQVKHVEMVPDPRSGKQLPIGETIGTVTLTEVSQDYASGNFVGDGSPKVGDRIVSKSPSKRP